MDHPYIRRSVGLLDFRGLCAAGTDRTTGRVDHQGLVPLKENVQDIGSLMFAGLAQ